MELHTVYRKFAVRQSHDLTLLACSRLLQTTRECLALHNQGMISPRYERRRHFGEQRHVDG